MNFKTLTDKILSAKEKSENRDKSIAEIFDEEFPNYENEEMKKDVIDSILVDTFYPNDQLAQKRKKELEEKYK